MEYHVFIISSLYPEFISIVIKLSVIKQLKMQPFNLIIFFVQVNPYLLQQVLQIE